MIAEAGDLDHADRGAPPRRAMVTAVQSKCPVEVFSSKYDQWMPATVKNAQTINRSAARARPRRAQTPALCRGARARVTIGRLRHPVLQIF